MSHRLFRGTLMSFTTGLAAVAAVLGVLGSAPASGASPAAPGDAIRAQEWWLAGLHVTRAWHRSDGAGIIVAVLGTGVAAGHPDLAGDVITGPDYSGSAPLGRGPAGSYWGAEGTAVAGIIGGHGSDGNWGIGIVGIAPAAKILSVRVTLEFNDPLASDQAISQRLPDAIAEGIRYAVGHGARVIDLPLDPGTLGLTGNGDPAAAGGSAAERAAVEYALHRNVVLVAPAGDDGQGPGIVNYPAAYPGVIAVGAIGRYGQLASFSSRRSYASLTAPGLNLVAAAPPDGYGQFSSTSAASGIVAGVAALIVSEFPHLTVAQVTRALVESTVTTAGGTAPPPLPGRSGSGTGYGTVDAARAIEMAALINSASQPRRPAAPPSRPPKPVRPAVAAAPPRTSAGELAGSVLRDAVVAVGALIALLALGLMVVRSRRGRAAAPGRSQARAGGQHEYHRADRAPASPVTPAPNGAGPGPRSRPQWPGPARAAAGRWPSPAGWQGGGIGEIEYPSPASSPPALAPAPRTGTGYRAGRGAGAEPGPAGPPWEPAPEPDRMIGPLPVAAAGSPRPEPGASIRIPGDMMPGAAPGPAATEGPAPGASSDLATPPADFDLSTPAFGLTPAAFGFAAPPGPDTPARDSLGFAAAPVPTDHATAPAAELTPEDGRSGPVAAADPSYIWDLAATDVFPAADPGQAAEAPPADAVPPSPDDPPGDGGS